MNAYEIAILFHPDLEIDLSKPQAKVEKIITDNGGSITNTDSWGKKKLAYPIARQEHAVYIFYTADLPPESVRKIEATLNITDEVIRYLLTRVDHKAIAKAEAARAEKNRDRAEREGDRERESEAKSEARSEES